MLPSFQLCQGDGPTSHYATLGEMSRDAPVILPPEQAVTYITVRPSEASKGNMTEEMQVHFHHYDLSKNQAVL